MEKLSAMQKALEKFKEALVSQGLTCNEESITLQSGSDYDIRTSERKGLIISITTQVYVSFPDH